VDIGENSCQLAPVVDGFLLQHQFRRVFYLSGRRVTDNLLDALRNRGYHLGQTRWQAISLANDVKHRLAFVAKDTAQYTNHVIYDKLHPLFISAAPKAALCRSVYEMQSNYFDATAPSGQVPLTATDLINCGELFFQPQKILNDQDSSIASLPELIEQTIQNCPIDVRQALWSNILLSGGSTELLGLPQRLEYELKQRYPSQVLNIQVRADEDRQFSVWKGGAVLGGLQAFQQHWDRKWEYEEVRQEAQTHVTKVFNSPPRVNVGAGSPHRYSTLSRRPSRMSAADASNHQAVA